MIEIFSKGQCAFCVEARKVARQRRFAYVEYDTQYTKYLDMLKERLPEDEHNYTRCPYIFWHGRYIGTLPDFLNEIENTIGGFGDQPF